MTKIIEQANLTEQELNEVKILIRLGDSEELAVNTVINNRSRKNNDSAYYAAYCL